MFKNLKASLVKLKFNYGYVPFTFPAKSRFIYTSKASLESKCLQKTEIKAHILEETFVSCSHLTPELKLHLITPECRLWNSTNGDPFNDPFWVFYWPGGQSVSRYILDNGGLVQNKRVLDFGCGCGASGLSSMKMEAKSVIFNDIDEAALIAVEQNGAINGIPVDVLTSSNLIGNDCKEVDVVLVGDMLYDTEFAAQVLNWLLELSKKNKKVLIGDPGRFVLNSHPLKDLLKCVAKYRLHPNTILENNGFQEAFVWELTHL